MSQQQTVQIRLWVLSLFFSIALFAKVGVKSAEIAVLGDSYATGAGADDSSTFDAASTLQLLLGTTQRSTPSLSPKLEKEFALSLPLPSPRVVEANYNTAYDPLSNVMSSAVQRTLQLAFDTPALSWGAMAASKLGASGDRLLIAASDLATSNDITYQARAVLKATGGQLPSKVLIFFAVSDVCRGNGISPMESKRVYNNYMDALKLLLRVSAKSRQSSTWVIVDPLSVTQFATRPALLEHKVWVNGEKRLCRDLYRGAVRSSKLSEGNNKQAEAIAAYLPPSPMISCPSLFSRELLASRDVGIFDSFDEDRKTLKIKELASERLSILASTVRSYREVLGQVAKEMTEIIAQSGLSDLVKIKHVQTTSTITFVAEDIGPDCFHMSQSGQGVLARTILAGMAK